MAARTISVCCLVAVLLCGGVNVASAATLIVGGVSPQTNALAHLPFSSSATFQVPKFHTFLGTLQGVTLEFRLTYTPEISVSNPTFATEAVVSASSSIPALVTYPTGQVEFLANAAFDTINPLLAIQAGPGGFTFIGPHTMSLHPAFQISAGELPAYIGPGMANFTLHYGDGTASGSNPVLEYFASATSRVTVDITYEYLPLPEPSSLALCVASSAVLFLRRRRNLRAR